MTKLILVDGIPGSGKSATARRFEQNLEGWGQNGFLRLRGWYKPS